MHLLCAAIVYQEYVKVCAVTVQVILDGIIQRLEVQRRHHLHTAAQEHGHSATETECSAPHLAGAMQAFSYIPENAEHHSQASGLGAQAVKSVVYALHDW
jgi:hypothetical protein